MPIAEIFDLSSHSDWLGISLLRAGLYEGLSKEYTSQNLSRRPHLVPSHFHFQYRLEGEGLWHSFSHGTQPFMRGDMILTPPGEGILYGIYPGGRFLDFWVELDGPTLRMWWEGDRLGSLARPVKVSESRSRCDDLPKFFSKKGGSENLAIEIANCLNHFFVFKHVKTSRSDPVAEIVEKIKARPEEDWDFHALAEKHHMSYVWLRKQITRLTGVSPLKFVHAERIQSACRKLLKGHSVKRCARDVGFEDANYFSRVFRQHMACSPQAFVASMNFMPEE